MNYELKLKQFSGPIEKLLEIIEEKKLDITEVNLAEVTADFLNYLNTLTQADNKQTRLLTDFIVIASQLLLIKSKALLPDLQLTTEEERDIKDLENRLRFYQQFKPTISYLKKLWEQNKFSISRPLFSGRPAIFYPSQNLKISELNKAMALIFETFQQFLDKTQIVQSPFVSLEEKIEEIMKRIGRGLNFIELTKEKSRSEIIVLFLALLHLLGNHRVKVEQKEKFSDIMITKHEK